MRKIDFPEEGKPHVEDVEISFFAQDKAGNIGISKEIVEIPANCGRWVKEAMILGFFEYFDKMIAPEGTDPERDKRMESARAELKRFGEIVAKGKAKIEARQAQGPQAVPNN